MNTPFPENDLPPGRHQLLKEHLMNEIRQYGTDPAAPARRKWLRPMVAGPAVAGALALAVVGGVMVAGSDGDDSLPAGRDGKATYAFAPRVNADTEDNAPEVLGRLATVAEKSKAGGDIRDDQYVYIDSKVAFTTHEEGKPSTMAKLHRREIWLSVDGTRKGLLREPGRESNENVTLERDPAPGEPGYDRSANYRHLQTLPTDPDEMLKWLYATVEKSQDSERELDQDAFVLVGDLIGETMTPPKVSAALYRAAAKIPGVVVVPDAVDAAGRHGVGIARVDRPDSTREELIFNEKTGEYLGEREVELKDGDGVKAGQVTGTAAVVKRAVVDKAGERP